MKNTETEKWWGSKRYASPELNVVDIQTEIGFCQSQVGKGGTEDLYEEDGDFSWE